MSRIVMRFCTLLAALVVLAGTASLAQSLGDVARQQRQKQQAKDPHTPPKKVITNEDIPEHPESVPEPSLDSSPSTPSNESEGKESSFHPASQVTQSGEQWKAAILAQKNVVASMQSDVDRLNASIHFVEANRYSNGVQYNQYQLKKQQEAQRVQKQLDEQKKKLADMQEAARKAGFGSSVYNP
jgi:hypothetical protein